MTMSPEATLYPAITHLREGVQMIGFGWTYLCLNETAAKQGQRVVTALLGQTMMACYPGIETTPSRRLGAMFHTAPHGCARSR
jgi:hypothetical protein